MNRHDVLSDEFYVRYSNEDCCLLIHTIHNGKNDIPIKISIQTLKELGRDDASKWVGETLLMLVPAMRNEVFGLKE